MLSVKQGGIKYHFFESLVWLGLGWRNTGKGVAPLPPTTWCIVPYRKREPFGSPSTTVAKLLYLCDNFFFFFFFCIFGFIKFYPKSRYILSLSFLGSVFTVDSSFKKKKLPYWMEKISGMPNVKQVNIDFFFKGFVTSACTRTFRPSTDLFYILIWQWVEF